MEGRAMRALDNIHVKTSCSINCLPRRGWPDVIVNGKWKHRLRHWAPEQYPTRVYRIGTRVLLLLIPG